MFALALATTAFFITCIKLFNSRFLFSNLAKIEGHKSSQKYLSIVGLVGSLIELYSNKTDNSY